MSQYNIKRLIQQEIYTPIDTDGYGIAPAVLFFLLAGGSTATAVAIGESEKAEREAKAAAQPEPEPEKPRFTLASSKRGMDLNKERRGSFKAHIGGGRHGVTSIQEQIKDIELPVLKKGDLDSDYPQFERDDGWYTLFGGDHNNPKGRAKGDPEYVNELKLTRKSSDYPKAGVISALNWYLFGGHTDDLQGTGGVSNKITQKFPKIIDEDSIAIGWMRTLGFDGDTEEALKMYQKYNFLPETGEVDRETWSHIIFEKKDPCDPMPAGGVCNARIRLVGDEQAEQEAEQEAEQAEQEAQQQAQEEAQQEAEEKEVERITKELKKKVEEKKKKAKWYEDTTNLAFIAGGVITVALLYRLIKRGTS